MPKLIIMAGPNGSGKSTTAPLVLKDLLQVDDFVNADVIAQGLCAFQPERAAIQAGRVMLERIHCLAREKANFAFETTLATRTFSTWIPTLKKAGYTFHLVFLWLNHVDLAITRVAERIKMGGHVVPEATIRRRYTAGLRNFFHLYQPISDSWQLYDNSDVQYFSAIASGNAAGEIAVMNAPVWNTLLAEYDAEHLAMRVTDRSSALVQDTETIRKAMQAGVKIALKQHKQAGNAICAGRDGAVVWIAPQAIPD